MRDLDQLHRAAPRETALSILGPDVVRSPLRTHLQAWSGALADHPDPSFVHYITNGIAHGFCVGFNHTSPLESARGNMRSALLHPEVVGRFVKEEVANGRLLELATGDVGTGEVFHLNRVGVVPKGHTPGKWRIIVDLSFLEGRSVNDGIRAEHCSLQYTTVQKIAQAAQSLGTGAQLAKLDVKSAYCLLPVHPEDRPLLAFEWKGHIFVDGVLPFGLRSAPKIFTAVADALEWIVRKRGVRFVDHYLDDFIVFGAPSSAQCEAALNTVREVCEELGVPLAMEKLEGPSLCLTLLGIEMDMQSGVLRLPRNKLVRVRESLRRWQTKKSCTRRELESLIGTLQHACRVIKLGRSFLRQMIDLLSIPKKPHHHVRLNNFFRADLGWWSVFAASWNGTAILHAKNPPDLVVTSDASGQWGCGAWCERDWFQYQWPPRARLNHITFKELFALLLAAATWGQRWRGQKVLWRCDNQAAVQAVIARSCRDQSLMHLLRCLFFFEAFYQFEAMAEYLPGRLNARADALSRNRRSLFFLKAPGMQPIASRLPSGLPEFLLQGCEWTSPRWTTTFVDLLIAA